MLYDVHDSFLCSFCYVVFTHMTPACVTCQVTADGSVDCANEPGEQEVKVASLVYAEVVTALSLLQPGGSFVLKMFTLFEHTSICLMYLLCCTFEQVPRAFDHLFWFWTFCSSFCSLAYYADAKSLSGVCPLLSLIHIWRCRRIERCRSRWSPYH